MNFYLHLNLRRSNIRKSKYKTLIFIFFLLATTSSWADYFTADYPSDSAQSELGTHIIISGKGLEVGDQWLRAAHTQSLLFHDRKLHGKIRVIGAVENDQTLSRLKNWGYKNIQFFNKSFSGPRLVEQIKQVTKIASIDMIGHNGAVLGFVLEDYDHRFFLSDVKSLQAVASRMSKDSFVRIMGCNTGWNLAPALASSLSVPVAGSFTFADIQSLHETQDWYYHDEGRYPIGKFLKTNSISYSEPVNCIANGGCLRLKPVHINYQGKHGNYAGTIPFLKYFCATIDKNDCARRAALSLNYAISVVAQKQLETEHDYNLVIADHFCPGYKSSEKREICRSKIISHLRNQKVLSANFTTSDGPTISCDHKQCAIQKDCSTGTCIMRGLGDMSQSKTFVNELNFYKTGIQILLKN